MFITEVSPKLWHFGVVLSVTWNTRTSNTEDGGRGSWRFAQFVGRGASIMENTLSCLTFLSIYLFIIINFAFLL